MKSILIIITLLLAGCATNPDVQKSVSRDKTMDNIAKKSLINEMINRPDPTVRLEGARIAKEFIAPKKRLFDF